jgi:hypothetical protein
MVKAENAKPVSQSDVVLNCSNIKQKPSQKPVEKTILINSNNYIKHKYRGIQNNTNF